jgi:hypothetical protein
MRTGTDAFFEICSIDPWIFGKTRAGSFAIDPLISTRPNIIQRNVPPIIYTPSLLAHLIY